MLLPRTPDALDAALTAIRNATDERNLRMLKRLILEAFQAERAEKEEAQAKVVLLEQQLERNQVIGRKARPEKLPGDQMILSKDRMISWEEAEQAIREKQPAIDEAQQWARRMEEHCAAANNDDEHIDNDEEVLLSPSPPPPPQTFLNDLDDGEPLSAVDDDDNDPFGFFETLPVASSSRRKL